jgi:hypothetical protein
MDTVEDLTIRSPFKTTGQESDGMSHPSNTSKDLVQMSLGASSLRMFSVLPVENEQTHYRRGVST